MPAIRKQFPCEICALKKAPPSSFTSKASLKGHIASQHAGEKLSCTDCNKFFNDASNLRRHRANTHKGDNVKTWVCRVCNTELGCRKDNAQRHTKTQCSAEKEDIVLKGTAAAAAAPATELPTAEAPAFTPLMSFEESHAAILYAHQQEQEQVDHGMNHWQQEQLQMPLLPTSPYAERQLDAPTYPENMWAHNDQYFEPMNPGTAYGQQQAEQAQLDYMQQNIFMDPQLVHGQHMVYGQQQVEQEQLDYLLQNMPMESQLVDHQLVYGQQEQQSMEQFVTPEQLQIEPQPQEQEQDQEQEQTNFFLQQLPDVFHPSSPTTEDEPDPTFPFSANTCGAPDSALVPVFSPAPTDSGHPDPSWEEIMESLGLPWSQDDMHLFDYNY